MKAAVTPAYGPAQVLETHELPKPSIGAHDVLIEVRATPVTEGDRRLRSADFPSISALPGRLMIGVRRPKHRVQGTMFAGRVVAVGSAVTRYAAGDDVFGSTDHGAYAEYLAMPEDGAMAKMPSGLRYDEAASVPYGAVTALRFLRDLGGVKPGDHVLVVGASGGVGRFAVELAKHLGAEVTGVCSQASFELVRSLGADHVIDYASEDFTANGVRYDVIFDIAGKSSFARCRDSLTENGRYLTLFVSVGILVQMALTSLFGGPQAKFGIAMGTHEDLEELRGLVERGVLRPVVASRFPLERIAEAHAEAENGRPHGSVVVTPVRAAD
jgi:NADPH:quinone reductase-like Zn-dependent oxidoreductase